jgi:hypothetical protein
MAFYTKLLNYQKANDNTFRLHWISARNGDFLVIFMGFHGDLMGCNPMTSTDRTGYSQALPPSFRCSVNQNPLFVVPDQTSWLKSGFPGRGL